MRISDWSSDVCSSDLPGSQHVEADTFQALMIDLVEGYLRHGAERIVVLNNGVSTEAPLRLAAHTILQRHGVRLVIADLPRLGKACDELWAAQAGGHADERGTSQNGRARSRDRVGEEWWIQGW